MKLRRLTLMGFKTFARRSEIVFDRGITAVVGPNGSGKSNIVDAIRWSLGETNARELRGARMDEVIYVGGAQKARMNVAEVELVIDNAEGRIPVEDAEVSIGRRVARNGESEYRLNGDRVRLRDIESALGATGLTQTGYSVIAQNDIDAIIQATPSQRRALVEQATGVRSLRAASEDALDKIARAEVALLRVDDLLEDAEPRLAALGEQAELALEQRQFTDRLAELRGNLSREEWRAARGHLKQARRRLDAALNRARTTADTQAEFNVRFEVRRASVTLAREQQHHALARLDAARLAAERAAGNIRLWLNRQRSAVLQHTAARVEAQRVSDTLIEAQMSLEQLVGSGADTFTGASEASRRVAEACQRHEAATALSAQADAATAAAEMDLERATVRRDAIVAAHRSATIRLDVLTGSIEARNSEIAMVRDRVRALETELAGIEAHAGTAAEEFQAAETASSSTQCQVTLARDGLRSAQVQFSRLSDVAQKSLARAATLRGQVDGALSGHGAVASAVDAGTLRATRLIDCFRVDDPANSAAIEAAMEVHLGAWLVDDLDTAAALLEGDAGREEILASNLPASVPSLSSPVGTRSAMQAITVIRPEAQGALEAVLDLVWLAPDVAVARSAVVKTCGRAVLSDGRVVSRAGLRGGGRPGSTLELAAQESAAAAAAVVASDAEQAARDAVQQCRSELDALEEHAAAAVIVAQKARAENAEAAVLLRNAREALPGERRHLITLEAGQRDHANELQAVEAAVNNAKTGALEAETLLDAARNAVEAARIGVSESRKAVDLAATDLRDAKSAAVEARLHSDDLERRLTAARETQLGAKQHLSEVELRLLATESEAITAFIRCRCARVAVRLAERDVAAASAVVETVAPALGEAERQAAAIELERSDIAIATARAADELAAAESEVAVADAQVAELADAVRDDLEDDGAEFDAQVAEKAEREIVRLERKIAGLGPVNGLAPEQHAELAVRVESLRAVHIDVAQAAADVRVLAERLGESIERRFDAVFGSVGMHFQDLFQELFPGGQATLRLEALTSPGEGTPEGLDGAEAATGVRSPKLPGVEILARPAGKRLQPLSLLSGGERALTALAVILALQQVNASPFYVFDEIDAPLDDSNILRLTKLLKRLSADQQFIVVTHNHVTMAAADVLYGVTIDQDGVSSVLSVRLAAAEQLGEVYVRGHRQAVVAAV